MGILVRQATRDDVVSIWRVRYAVRKNTLRPGVISDQEVVDHLESLGRGWVAEDGSKVVAFAIGNARDGNIWALFVDPPHERRGIGRRLHDTMARWLWSQGLTRLWLTTGLGTRAEGFYRAAGWQCVGPADHGDHRFELQRAEDSAFGCGRAGSIGVGGWWSRCMR